MSKSLKGALQLAALGVGVTILGLVIGAFLMSPGVSREQRLIAFVALGGAAGVVLLYDLAVRAVTRLRKGRSRRATLASAHRPSSATAPTIKLTSRGGKTPRTVQALAAAGAAPAEIAWKTGLPLDAVSMLLEIGGRR